MNHRLLSCAVAGALFLALARPGFASPSLPATDAGEITYSYQQLVSQYYKKTDPQVIVDGARSALLLVLHEKGFPKATLPAIRASVDVDADTAAVRKEVEDAQRIAHAKIGAQLLSYVAISGMLDSVHDRYTVFLTPKDYAELNQGLDGTDFGGTGIVIELDDTTKAVTVSNVVPDGPADKAGIEQDDVISAINGASTKGYTLEKASAKLRGKIGTKVTVTITRDGNILPPITITRGKIHELSVYERMLPDKIGYVELTVFGLTTGSELTTALDRLQQEGARAIIMDLRDNGGGYLDAAVAVSSKFIPTGPIVSVESRASNITTFEADDDAIQPVPLAVLVNGYTASASEITSGAIQDDAAGEIIGTKTFGKGVVQNIYPLPDGSAIKITTARYLTPHNRDINHRGITPDIIVAENKHPHYGDPDQDAQLRRAIDYLDQRLAHLDEATPPPVAGSAATPGATSNER